MLRKALRISIRRLQDVRCTRIALGRTGLTGLEAGRSNRKSKRDLGLIMERLQAQAIGCTVLVVKSETHRLKCTQLTPPTQE